MTEEQIAKEHKEDHDETIESMGEFGPWHLLYIGLVSLVLVPSGMPMITITFMNARSDFWCRREISNMSVENWREMSSPLILRSDGSFARDQCHVWASKDFQRPHNNATVACNEWEHDRSIFTATLLQDFDLVCHKAFYENFAQVVFQWGGILGNGGAFLSDFVGRRPALFLLLLLGALSSSAISMVQDIHLFLLLRVIQAMGASGSYAVVSIWSMELVGGKWKTIVGVFALSPWSLAWFSVAALVHFTTNWRHAQLLTAALSFCALLLVMIMPESPKWLLATRNPLLAEKIVMKAAKMNKRELSSDFHLRTAALNDNKQDSSITLLIFNRKMLPKLLLLCNSWITVAFVYYGLTLNSGNLASDIFLSFLLNGLVDLPSYALVVFILLKGGRKRPFVILFIIAGLTLMATILVPEGVYTYNWPAMVLTLIGRFCISAIFSTVFIYTSELIPTQMRGSGMGLCYLSSRFGSMFAPYVGSLDRTLGVMVPIAIFGSSALIAGVLNLMLPETSSRKLPDTMEEAEAAELELPRCCRRSEQEEKRNINY